MSRDELRANHFTNSVLPALFLLILSISFYLGSAVFLNDRQLVSTSNRSYITRK